MDISVASALLVTHSRFADVYSLFEETMELLPEAKVKEFMADVGDIRSKLDRWKTLFSYEKEKKSFLVAKCHARCTRALFLRRPGGQLCGVSRSVTGSGRDEFSQEGVSTAGSSCATPRSIPSSEQRLSSALNNGTPTPEEAAPEDTLPLVLENESDETWLLSAPAPLPAQSLHSTTTAAAAAAVVSQEEKTRNSLLNTVQSTAKPQQENTKSSTKTQPLTTTTTMSTPISTPTPEAIQPKSGSSLKSRIPKPPPSPKRGVFDDTAKRTAVRKEGRERALHSARI